MTASAPQPTNLYNAPKGVVYWITGLPGSGKSTFAHALTNHLRAAGRPSLLMDADEIRLALGAHFNFSREDRRKVGSIYGRLALIISSQGYDVTCATVSMFEDVRRWNRSNIPIYREIFIRTPGELIVKRHPQGLYARALKKSVRNVPGVDQYAEDPKSPDIVIDNTESFTRQDLINAAKQIARHGVSSHTPSDAQKEISALQTAEDEKLGS